MSCKHINCRINGYLPSGWEYEDDAKPQYLLGFGSKKAEAFYGVLIYKLVSPLSFLSLC
jgi:hypothetical protein